MAGWGVPFGPEKHRLIFVKGTEEADRHPRMRALIARSQAGLVRRRFATLAELVAGLYAALVQYLESREHCHPRRPRRTCSDI